MRDRIDVNSLDNSRDERIHIRIVRNDDDVDVLDNVFHRLPYPAYLRILDALELCSGKVCVRVRRVTRTIFRQDDQLKRQGYGSVLQ